MRGTVLRCQKCGSAKERKRRSYFGGRVPIDVCFCTPVRHDRPFVQVSNPRRLAVPGMKLEQRE